MSRHVQLTFFTRDSRFSVPSDPISVPVSSTVNDLQNIITQLLNEELVVFDFLINNEFIDGTLDEFINKKKISSEIIDVEYTARQAAPVVAGEIVHEDFVSCVRRRQNYILTSAYDGAVRLQTVDKKDPIFTLTLNEKVKVVEWVTLGETSTEESLFLTGGFAQVVRLWVWNPTLRSVRCAAVCRGHQGTILSMASTSQINNSKDKLFASGSWDSSIKIWSSDPNETDLSEETGGISHQRKSEDKLPVRIPRLTLAGHRNMVSKVAWLEEAGQSQPKLVSCSWDQTIRVWDVTASASDTTGKCGESRCISVGSPLHDLSVAPQGVLVGASDNKVRIYDLRAKDALAQIGFQGHTAWLSSVAWAPHRPDQFVTGSVDQSVRLWDTRNLTASLYDLMGHTDMVTCVDWAAPVLQGKPGGGGDRQPQHYILSSSGDGTVKIYNYVA
ncbi:WD repeat-containing protein 12 [Sparganum proliferum]